MMELAGFHLASLTRRCLDGSLQNKRVILLAGKGNNGGGGLVATRHLSNWGVEATLITSQEEGFNETVSARLQTLEALDVNIIYFSSKLKLSRMINKYDLVIDALIGYNLKGDPRYPVSEIIDQAYAAETPILSLDLPSGLDATTGKNFKPCIIAEKTLTLALLKRGLLVGEARDYIGELFLADKLKYFLFICEICISGKYFTSFFDGETLVSHLQRDYM